MRKEEKACFQNQTIEVSFMRKIYYIFDPMVII
jgi:hypothetical protein